MYNFLCHHSNHSKGHYQLFIQMLSVRRLQPCKFVARSAMIACSMTHLGCQHLSCFVHMARTNSCFDGETACCMMGRRPVRRVQLPTATIGTAIDTGLRRRGLGKLHCLMSVLLPSLLQSSHWKIATLVPVRSCATKQTSLQLCGCPMSVYFSFIGASKHSHHERS